MSIDDVGGRVGNNSFSHPHDPRLITSPCSKMSLGTRLLLVLALNSQITNSWGIVKQVQLDFRKEGRNSNVICVTLETLKISCTLLHGSTVKIAYVMVVKPLIQTSRPQLRISRNYLILSVIESCWARQGFNLHSSMISWIAAFFEGRSRVSTSSSTVVLCNGAIQ